MKAVGCLVGLCLLASFVAGEHYAWKAGQTYTFSARGRLMTGIAEINRQYAGLELDYNIDLIVVGPNRLNLRPSQFRILEVNEELKNGGWRDASELNSQTPVELQADLKTYLESPFEVEMSKGVIKSIKVAGNLPTWAVNIKKAQASKFILDTTGSNAVLNGNLAHPLANHVRPEEASTDSGYFFEVMEESVLGECETYYTVSQTGPFPAQRSQKLQAQQQQQQQQDDQNADSSESSEESQELHSKYSAYKQLALQQPDQYQSEDLDDAQSQQPYAHGLLVPELFHKFCQDQNQLYEITKAINYTSCKNKPVLGYVSPALLLNSRPGDNNAGSMLNRIAFSRYIACGKDRKQYTILKIQQEEVYKFGRLATEKIVGGTVKNVTLIDLQPTSRVPAEIPNPKVISDLTYTFDPKEQKMRREGDNRLKTGFIFGNEQNDEDEQNQVVDEQEFQSQRNSRRQRSVSDQQDDSTSSSEESNEQQNQEKYETTAENRGYLPMPSMTNPPLNPMLASPLTTQAMKKRVQVLLAEVVQDLTDKNALAESETISKIAIIAKILRFFKYSEVEELYHLVADKSQTDEDQISRNVFLDAVAIAGTNPNIKFLIDLVAKKQVTGETAAQLVMTFSHYIRTPTQQLIKYFYEQLVDASSPASATSSSQSGSVDQIKTNALLAFTNLLHDACVNTRVMYSRYPIAQYGEFCSHSVVEREYLKPLLEQTKFWIEQVEKRSDRFSAKHWVTVYMAALGNIGHPAVAKDVQQWLDDLDDSYLKVKVIYVLKRLVVSRSAENIPVSSFRPIDRKNSDLVTDEIIEKNVLPIIVAVAFDKTEDFEVRNAAVSLLLRSTVADLTLWQQLAYMTWFEKNQQVHSYVFTVIRSLAELNEPVDDASWRAHHNAKTVFHLMKPIDMELEHFGKSAAKFDSAWYPELHSGYLHHYSYFGSLDSWIPNAVHYHDYVNMGEGIGFSSTQFNLHSDSIRQLINHFVGKFSKPSFSDINGNDAIKQIVDLLHIVDREEQDEPQADLHIKLRNEMERIFSFNKEVIDQFVEQVKRSYISELQVGVPINYQKATRMGSIVIETPTIFGIPAAYNFRLSSLTSVRGTVKVTNQNFLQDVQLQAELHPIRSWKLHAKISFKVPFTGKKYQSGIQYHHVMEFPFRAVLRKSPTGELQFGVTPTHLSENNVAGEIQIMTFHRRPYTAIITDELWPTSHKEGGEMKIVHALDKPFEDSQSFGEKSFGMNFRVEHLSEFRSEQEQLPAWLRHYAKFVSPASLYHFGVRAPTLALAERKLILDVSQSKTKTIWIMLAAKYTHNGPNSLVSNQDSSEESNELSGEQQPSQHGYNVHNVRMQQQQQQQQQQRARDASQSRKSYQQQQQQQNQQPGSSEEQSNENEEKYEGQFQWPVSVGNQEGTYAEQLAAPSGDRRVVVAVAVIGKSAPIQSPVKARGIQKHLEKDNLPSTVQLLFTAESENDEVLYRLSLGSPTKEAAKLLPQESEAFINIRDALVNSPLSNMQVPFCFVYNGEYRRQNFANRDDLLILRERLFKQDLSVSIRGKLEFGQSCRNPQYNISFSGTAERDQEMTEYAKSGSEEAKQCSEDEKRGFKTSNVCIVNADKQAAVLNFVDLKFKASPLPVEFVNVTLQVEQFIHARLWRYMSYNPMPTTEQHGLLSSENSLRVQLRMSPDQEYASLKVFKPSAIHFFENIRTDELPLAQTLFPLTSTQSLVENVRDRVYGLSKSEVSCSIESNFVSTFDNVTFSFDPEATEDCWHVLAQIEGEKSVSVLAHEVANNQYRTTVLLPGNFRIDLLPAVPKLKVNQNNNQYTTTNQEEYAPSTARVVVNGKTIKDLPIVLRDSEKKFIARIEVAADFSLQVFSPVVQVTTNGRHIVIFGSEVMRNSTVGICGDFNGEKSVEFRSPRDCPLSTGTLLTASYAFQSWDPKDIQGKQCSVNSEIKKEIEREELDCQSQEFFIPYLFADMSCKDKLVAAIGDTVYTIVRNALRPIPGVNGKKWAEKARQKVKDLLQGAISPSNIAEIIATGISSFIPVVGKLVKPLIKKAVELIVEQICKGSTCCDTMIYF